VTEYQRRGVVHFHALIALTVLGHDRLRFRAGRHRVKAAPGWPRG
jgi:hypothetical protein